jgi:ribosomal-protein-alanine N-acetyltransferase
MMTGNMFSNGEIRLRPLRESDAEAWHTYLSDPAVIERTSYPVLSLDEVRRIVAESIAGFAAGASRRYAIARVVDDRLIGTAGFPRWAANEQVSELAYDLERAQWGRGLMTGIVKQLVAWAFAETPLSRIEALTRTDNEASQRVLLKCGFVFERTLREHRICRGVPYDFHLFCRLR